MPIFDRVVQDLRQRAFAEVGVACISRFLRDAHGNFKRRRPCDSRAKEEALLGQRERRTSSFDTSTSRSFQFMERLQTFYGRARCLPSDEDRGDGRFATRKGDLADGFDGVRSSPGAVRDSDGGGEAAHSNAG